MCNHSEPLPASCVVSTHDVNFCALLDSGAQVSLRCESIFNQMKLNYGNLSMFELSGSVISGIDGSKTEVL